MMERVYRGFLRLLPARFREEYGVAMAELFARRLDELPRRRIARLRFLAGSCLDVVWQSVSERWSRAPRRGSARWGGALVDFAMLDLRHALRSLRRSPGLSLIATVALALGIGLTTLMFSIVYGVLVRELPFPRSDELVEVYRRAAAGSESATRIHDYLDVRRLQRSFEGLAAHERQELRLSNDAAPAARLEGARVTPELFRVLGVSPAVGRSFTAEDGEAGAPRTALISWSLWHGRFGGDPDMVGRSVRIEGRETVVVGVMPRRFGYPNATHVWVPLDASTTLLPRGEGPRLYMFGRLRAGVSLERAQSDLDVIAQQLAAAYPEPNRGSVMRAARMEESRLSAAGRTTLYSMFGAVLLVLLIVCANLANLLTGRASVRAREVAIRTALGSSRPRVVRQLLLESLLLGLAGALLGSLLAALGIRWFNGVILAAEPPPYFVDIRLDVAALGCALGAAWLASVVSGLVPAIQASRGDVQVVMKDESRGASSFRLGRLTRGLVIAEMALSMALLIGAGLTIKSVVKLYSADLGFDAAQTFATRIEPPVHAYPQAADRLALAEALVARVRALPRVQVATMASSAPGLSAPGFALEIDAPAEDTPAGKPVVSGVFIAPGFFASLGMQPLQGREFSEFDRQGSLPVAVVNRSFEERFFRGASAIGRRIRLGDGTSDEPWLTVVGIVPEAAPNGIENQPPEAAYRPLAQSQAGSLMLLARTDGPATDIALAVREVVASIDPELPMESTGSLDLLIYNDNWDRSVFGRLFVLFGASALFIAMIGLYGVTAFAVSQRRREMGVRQAVGAARSDIVALVMRQGLFHVGIGLLIGLALAAATSQLLAGLLFKVDPRDPAVFAAITVALTATAALACWIPARRAASANPLDALRSD